MGVNFDMKIRVIINYKIYIIYIIYILYKFLFLVVWRGPENLFYFFFFISLYYSVGGGRDEYLWNYFFIYY